MEVKILQGVTNTKKYAEQFESKVQQFLDENPEIKIHQIKQSSAASGDSDGFDVLTIVSIWYENE